MENYFVRYNSGQQETPYQLPEGVRLDLEKIEGLRINNISQIKPLVVASIPKDRVDEVRGLDCIDSVVESRQYGPAKRK